jgi:methyl-accepting chemotaxis protein
MAGESLSLATVIQAVADAVRKQHAELRDEIAMVQSVSEREVLAAGGAIAKIFEEMTEHTARLSALKAHESSDSAKGSFAAVLTRFAGEMPALLGVLVNETTSQSRLASGAAVQIREVTNLAEDMSRIAQWCRVVASNARVEAAHAGELGAGFAVLADSLAAMSNDIARATKSIQDRATAVRGIVSEMADGAAKVAAEGRARTATMKASVSECQKAYQDGVVGSIHGFEQNAASIRDRSNAALSHLQFQDRLQQSLDHVLEGNARIVAGLESLAADLAGAEAPASIERLEDVLHQLFTNASALAVVRDLAGSERSDGEVQFL